MAMNNWNILLIFHWVMGCSFANFFSNNERVESVLTRCTANDYQSRSIPKYYATEHFLLRLEVIWHKNLMAQESVGFPRDVIWRITFQLMGKLLHGFRSQKHLWKKNELTKVMYGGKWILEIAEVRAYLIHFTKSMQHEGRAVVQLILH